MENLKVALRYGISTRSVDANGYLCDFLDNVYGNKMNEEHRKMFEHGSGSELQTKARAVHSSSMLGYNFFSWIDEQHPFIWEDVSYTKVYFEVQLRTIRRSPAPANMDIVLDGTNKDGKRVLLFIESKFLEYTSKGAYKLSSSYSNWKNYFENTGDWGAIDYEMRVETRSQNERYNEGLKQSFCHLVALNAMRDERALAWFNTNNVLKIDNLNDVEIRFMNAIFSPNERFGAEHKLYNDYKEYYAWFMRFIERIAPYSVQPKWFSYSDIWKQMKSQINDQDRIAFLQRRYMDFAEICK